MAGEQDQRGLFPKPSADVNAVVVNDRCLILTQHGIRVLIVSAMVIAQSAVDERMTEAHAMVSLVEQGWADQNDVARAFARSPRTLRRYERRVETGGLAALGRSSGFPTGRRRLKPARLRLVARLKADGLSNRAVAQRVGVSEKAVRKLLRRLGWSPATGEQEALPLPSAPADPNLSALSIGPSPAAPAEPRLARAAEAEAAVTGADSNLSAFGAPPENLPVSFDTGRFSGGAPKADRFESAPVTAASASAARASRGSAGAAGEGPIDKADRFGSAGAEGSGNASCSPVAGLQPSRRRSFRTAFSLTPTRWATARFDSPSALSRATSRRRAGFSRRRPVGNPLERPNAASPPVSTRRS